MLDVWAEDAQSEIDRLRAELAAKAGEVEALRACLDGVGKTRAPKPRILAQRGTGSLRGEQQYCFEMGYREGAAAVRKAISEKVAAIAARKAAKRAAQAQAKGSDGR